MRITRWRILYLILAVSAAATVTSAQEAAPDYPTILRRVEQHPTQIRSVLARYTSISSISPRYATERNTPADYGLQTVTEVEWAFKGNKRYERESPTGDASLQNAHQKSDAKNHREMTRIFDGNDEHNFDSAATTARGTYHYDSITHKHSPSYMSPLDCGYLVYGKWILNALHDGHGALTGTEQDPHYGLLAIVSCQGDAGSVVRLWIAPSHNFMSVRTEHVYKDLTKPNAFLVITQRCIGSAQVDGIWMPTECTIESVKRTDGSDALDAKTVYKDISYKLNEVPDSQFDTTMPPGSVVSDAAAGTRYTVGLHGERILDERLSTASNSLPVRWLFMVSLTTILVLGMGVLAKWRRHGSHM